MAWFGLKKDGPPSGGGNGGSGPNGGGDQPMFAPQPEKAAVFFDRARTIDETGNFEYAVTLWLQGLRQDWTGLRGVEGFFGSMAKFLGESNGKPVSKDVVKSVQGKTEVDKYLAALLEWGQKPADPPLAVRALEMAANLNLVEPGRWIGERALGWVLNGKPQRNLLVKCSEAFEKLGIFDRAINAADAANKISQDPQLANRIRNLAAKATMTRGGYDQVGQAGGFRSNVRDQAKQQQLEDADRITKTDETVDRLVQQAEQQFAQRPDDIPTLEVLCKRLLERGRPEDETRAMSLMMDAYKKHNQFRFREFAGKVNLRQKKRAYLAAEEAAKADPSKAEEAAALRKAWGDQAVAELKLQVENYPTDLVRKFEYGKVLHGTERYEEAIPVLQEAQADPRYRSHALGMLAECFRNMSWIGEAIETYRSALEVRDLPGEQAMDLQYGLMRALEEKAIADKDLAAAEEAEKIASGIAMKQLNYKDVRQRRESLKKLVASLKSGG